MVGVLIGTLRLKFVIFSPIQVAYLTLTNILEQLQHRFNKNHCVENSVVMLQIFTDDLQKLANDSSEEYTKIMVEIVNIVHLNLEASIKYCLENHSNSWLKLKRVTTKNFLEQLEMGLNVNNQLLQLIQVDALKNRLLLDNNKIDNLKQKLVK